MDEFEAIGSRCLALHLRRAARRIGRIYDEKLRPVGINNGQFSLLAILAATDGRTMQALADVLGLDQSSLSAAVKPLMRRGLVSAWPCVEDRRVRRLGLTPAGRLLIQEAQPFWSLAQDQADRLLAGRSPDRLRSAMRALS